MKDIADRINNLKDGRVQLNLLCLILGWQWENFSRLFYLAAINAFDEDHVRMVWRKSVELQWENSMCVRGIALDMMTALLFKGTSPVRNTSCC